MEVCKQLDVRSGIHWKLSPPFVGQGKGHKAISGSRARNYIILFGGSNYVANFVSNLTLRICSKILPYLSKVILVTHCVSFIIGSTHHILFEQNGLLHLEC